MKISIITICFNSAETIRRTIESVLAQSFEEIEYIIVDGASTDGTLAIIDEYRERIAKRVSERDDGIYDAMNKGIALATGDVVGILNSDDFFDDDDVIRDVAEAFFKAPEADLVFGDVVFVRPDNLREVARYYSSARFRPWKLRFGWMPPHPATFVRHAVYQKFGKYRTDFTIASDYEMFVRWLLVHGLEYKRIDKVLVRMRTGGISTRGLASTVLLNREIVKACRSNGVYTNLLAVLSKFPLKLLELLRRPRSER